MNVFATLSFILLIFFVFLLVSSMLDSFDKKPKSAFKKIGLSLVVLYSALMLLANAE